MSDDPTNEVDSDEVVDLGAMTEDQLRAYHAELTTKIEELRSGPLTVETAEQVNELRRERNATVEAVNTLIGFASDGDTDGELPSTAPEATDATIEATDAEATITEGEADTAATEGTITTEEVAVSDQNDNASAEVLAAAEQVVAEGAPAMAVAAGARPTAPAVTRNRPRIAFVAGAGQRAFAQGVEMNDEALARAWDSAKGIRPGPDGEAKAVVASLPAFEDTHGLEVDMLSANNTTRQNDALIEESVQAWRAQRSGAPVDARVAAICEPLDIIREIPDCGETDTPFTNLFPQRPVGRLGFQFTRASSAADTDDAINLWTQSDQDAIDEGDPDTWKPCIPIDCATPDEVTAEELVTCITVDSSTEISSPERVKEFMQKLRVQRARRREQIQLTRFDATAMAFTSAGQNGYGTIPSFVQAVESMLPMLAYPERLDETDWDIVVEPGFLNKVVIDLYGQCNPAEQPGARSAAATWLSSYLGRSVVGLRDFKGSNPYQSFPAPGDSAVLNPLPSTDRIRFVPAGAYIYGSTGEESTGWQTDPQLVRQNKKQAFSAEWFLLAKHGCHPAAIIDLTSAPSGGRGGCVTPFNYSEGGS